MPSRSINRIERVDGTWTVQMTHLSGPALAVRLDLPWPDAGAGAIITVDGEVVTTEGWLNRWGVGVLPVGEFTLEPGSVRLVEARQES